MRRCSSQNERTCSISGSAIHVMLTGHGAFATHGKQQRSYEVFEKEHCMKRTTAA